MSVKPCLDCGRGTSQGSRCPEHQRAYEARRDQRRGSSTQRGYGSAWQRISAQVLERDDHICGYCGARATTVDHIVAKKNGGTDDMANLMGACVHCNSAKKDR